jgi:hypothetical protein
LAFSLWAAFRSAIEDLCTGLPDFSWDNRYTKTGKMIQNDHKITKTTKSIPNSRNIFQMGIKYTIIFRSKALQNLAKFGFLVWK